MRKRNKGWIKEIGKIDNSWTYCDIEGERGGAIYIDIVVPGLGIGGCHCH